MEEILVSSGITRISEVREQYVSSVSHQRAAAQPIWVVSHNIALMNSSCLQSTEIAQRLQSESEDVL